MLPKIINSKQKYDVGPSNNYRNKLKVDPSQKVKTTFGFVQVQSEDNEGDDQVK